ncbi:MAG: HU family DNA-binding protein [Rickettsiaceae bacterium]|jgi:DNA-binding protein HU-beta|nr:HU family DNA-binding protein [Rickettsiales bacterium]MCP5362774.1 HU family DNA-binding protein [Rickettsiaceae bacterium]MCP5378368.1 HU family DNA-binding protein [Rickettsiaceae bacterium]WPX98195.1 HU family DNA-binding protein [Candidatus Megaera polyxenophila]
MNKGDFISFIADKHDCTKAEAERVIDMFTSSVIGALGKGEEVTLVGFGSFSVSKVAARSGRNPRTGAAIQIAQYNQPKFKVGQKLKDACNNKK